MRFLLRAIRSLMTRILILFRRFGAGTGAAARIVAAIGVTFVLVLSGCGENGGVETTSEVSGTTEEEADAAQDNTAENAASLIWEKVYPWYTAGKAGEGTYEYFDAAGNRFEASLNAQAYANDYDKEAFSKTGDGYGDVTGSYKGSGYTTKQGIDVSSHCGEIDWKAVRSDGIDFAIIQLGYRGYTEGGLNVDSYFEKNMDGAIENGLDVGVYFFSQAVNQQEAVQEAEFAMKTLRSYAESRGMDPLKILQLPFVYDPENIGNGNARTDDVSGSQFSANCRAFCSRIAREGYQPAVYCNAYWQAYVLDMAQLNEYDIWYADFWSYPQSPYHFSLWQYTYTGKVDGMAEGITVDKDLWLIPEEISQNGSGN